MLNVLFGVRWILRRGFYGWPSASKAIALAALQAIGFDRQVDSVLAFSFLVPHHANSLDIANRVSSRLISWK